MSFDEQHFFPPDRQEYEYWEGVRNAAPELLEALEKIVEFNRQTAEDQYGNAARAERWPCVITARAAIAKAKGEDK